MRDLINDIVPDKEPIIGKYGGGRGKFYGSLGAVGHIDIFLLSY